MTFTLRVENEEVDRRIQRVALTDNCRFCGTYIQEPYWLDLAAATLARRDDERALDQCRISMGEFHRRRRLRFRRRP